MLVRRRDHSSASCCPSLGLLLGEDIFSSEVRARIFTGGALEPVEVLVTTTSEVREIAPIASEYGVAAAWVEDSGRISVSMWDSGAGWQSPSFLMSGASSVYTLLGSSA